MPNKRCADSSFDQGSFPDRRLPAIQNSDPLRCAEPPKCDVPEAEASVGPNIIPSTAEIEMTTLRCNMIFIFACHSCSTQGQIRFEAALLSLMSSRSKKYEIVRVYARASVSHRGRWRRVEKPQRDVCVKLKRWKR